VAPGCQSIAPCPASRWTTELSPTWKELRRPQSPKLVKKSRMKTQTHSRQTLSAPVGWREPQIFPAQPPFPSTPLVTPASATAETGTNKEYGVREENGKWVLIDWEGFPDLV
jgi:hypothetical protein